MKGQAGFSLIEVLIAVALVGILASTLPGALMGATRSTVIAGRHTTAETLARSQVDYIQNQPYDSVNTTPVYALMSDIPASYSIDTPMAARLDPRGDGTANDDGLQEITVTVKYDERIVLTLVDYKVNFRP